MTVKNVVDLIKLDEGTQLKVYICTAGKTSIGVGRNLQDKGITQEEADYLLSNDLRECRHDLMTFQWFGVLDEVRQAAVTSLRFNLGPNRFRDFVKFLAAMHRGDYARAGAELVDSRWYQQVGERGPRLVKMIQLGAWPA